MIAQVEAERLMLIEKKRKNIERYNFPSNGDEITIPIISIDEKEEFLLDVHRGKIQLLKCTYQKRYQSVMTLIRLDLNGSPHTNPYVDEIPFKYLDNFNGIKINKSHLHIYIENFMDKWALPIPADKFPNINDLYQTLEDFFKYCNIIDPPVVDGGLYDSVK